MYMVSTPYKTQLNPNRYNDDYILNSSQQLAPYEYWTANIQKRFTLQLIFLRPSVFDTTFYDYLNPKFESVIKEVSIKRHINLFGMTFLLHSQKSSYFKVKNSLQFFYILKSAFKIGSLRNYDENDEKILFENPQKIKMIDP